MKRLSNHFLELVHAGLLASYWHRKPFAKFLRRHHVTEGFLATWTPEETKRDLLDRLFPRLETAPKGSAIILDMARSLSEQTSYPDLERLEDSKTRIEAATTAVRRLRAALLTIDEEARDEKARDGAKERFQQMQEQAAVSAKDLGRLTARLTELSTRLGTQEAGYDFQAWFYDLMDFSDVTNRRPYVTHGRQIDGSITLEGTTYLIETKFTVTQSDAADIDSLRSKVLSKADNTMGIMVSISGYSSVARNEASGARTPLLLLDAQHLYAVLTGAMRFADIVQRVKRHAAQTGEAYLAVSEFG